MSNVSLSISRLSLNGFSASTARRVVDGFQAELERAANSYMPSYDRHTPAITTRKVTEQLPERIGADAARALLESLQA